MDLLPLPLKLELAKKLMMDHMEVLPQLHGMVPGMMLLVEVMEHSLLDLIKAFGVKVNLMDWLSGQVLMP